MSAFEIKDEIRQQIKAIILLALAALCFAALNFTAESGEVGIFINNVLRVLTGELAIVVPLILFVLALQQILPQRIGNLRQRVFGVLLFLFILLIASHLKLMETRLDLLDKGIYRASLELGYSQQGGGIIGAVLSMMLYFLFREVGSKIVIVALVLISFLLITNYSFVQLFQTTFSVLLFCGRSLRKCLAAVIRIGSFLFSSYDAGQEQPENKASRKSGKRKEADFDTPMEETIIPAHLEPAATLFPPQTEEPALLTAGKLLNQTKN
jgi:DNA segregation ATPase FtsK/SpoIIIE, S-DNA-T family